MATELGVNFARWRQWMVGMDKNGWTVVQQGAIRQTADVLI